MRASRCFILTGERGSGKTSLCLRIVDEALRRSMDVAGIISPAIFSAGEKTGISARNARNGENRVLAKKIGGQGSGSETRALSPGLCTKMWSFDETVLEWGNLVFLEACPCDILFVDELGPLELERGQGWSNALAAIRSRLYGACIVVVRPELVMRAVDLFPGSTLVDLAREVPDSGFFLESY